VSKCQSVKRWGVVVNFFPNTNTVKNFTSLRGFLKKDTDMFRASTDGDITDCNGQHDEHVHENGDPEELRIRLFDYLYQRHCGNVTFFCRTKSGKKINYQNYSIFFTENCSRTKLPNFLLELKLLSYTYCSREIPSPVCGTINRM